MQARRFMTPEPAVIDAGATLDEACDRMELSDVRHLPAVAEGRLVGLLVDRDLYRATGWLPQRAVEREGLLVRDVMHAPAPAIAPEDDLTAAPAELVLRGLGCVVVARDARVLGVVTELDLLRLYLEVRGPGAGELAVRDHMTPEPLVTATPEVTVAEALERMHRHRVRHLPVLVDGELEGVVSDRDLLRALGRCQPSDLALEHVFAPGAIVTHPDDTLARAATLFLQYRVSALLVLDGPRMVGILTSTDAVERCLHWLRAGGAR